MDYGGELVLFLFWSIVIIGGFIFLLGLTLAVLKLLLWFGKSTGDRARVSREVSDEFELRHYGESTAELDLQDWEDED